ncbi:MAG: RNA polymerase-binding protein DksA [Pseudomonadota bacterium]
MTDSTEAFYTPSNDEDFMNSRQRDYFRAKLESWKSEILAGSKTTINNLQEDSSSLPDIVDRASAESDKALELRTRDRQRKLISKIDAALRRIDNGTYGYCDETGEPIGLKRLEARPTATLSLEAQERHERRERTLRDD